MVAVDKLLEGDNSDPPIYRWEAKDQRSKWLAKVMCYGLQQSLKPGILNPTLHFLFITADMTLP